MTDYLFLDPGYCGLETGEGEVPQEEAGKVLPRQKEGMATGRQTHGQMRGWHSESCAGGGDGGGQQKEAAH